MAQRTLACTGCHGAAGPRRPGWLLPAHRRQARRLPVQPAAELSRRTPALRADGAAARPACPTATCWRSRSISHALDLPYPPPQPSSAPAAQLQRGQQLALHGDSAARIPACAQCHGEALTGVAPNTPGLLGLPRDYLNAQLGAWRSGQRRAHAPDCMAQIASRLRPERPRRGHRWLVRPALPADPRPARALSRAAANRLRQRVAAGRERSAMKRRWMAIADRGSLAVLGAGPVPELRAATTASTTCRP